MVGQLGRLTSKHKQERASSFSTGYMHGTAHARVLTAEAAVCC